MHKHFSYIVRLREIKSYHKYKLEYLKLVFQNAQWMNYEE